MSLRHCVEFGRATVAPEEEWIDIQTTAKTQGCKFSTFSDAVFFRNTIAVEVGRWIIDDARR